MPSCRPQVDWLPAAGDQVCAPGECHLWRHDLRRYGSTGNELEDRTLWSLLSDDERERAARFHFSRDRNAYVAARSGLRRILSLYTAIAPADLVFTYGIRGKPALAHAGLAPGLSFNLAHSGAYAVYAIGNRRQIGVDVEKKRPDLAIDDLAAANFSPQERSVLQELPAEARLGRFFALWTCKEAYVKARGEGLHIPLDSFHVLFGADGDARLHAPDGRWQLRLFAADEAHPVALVHDGEAARYRCHEL